MIKSKKQSLIVIGAFIIVLLLGTTTYAFFNYTRTGSSNTIKVGRISFVSKNEQTISLSNLFPIDPSNTTDMNDNTKVGTYSLDIEGDTDYVDGIEYLVSITNANIYTSTGKTVPISINVTTEDLGSPNANYFTARETKDTLMYKKIIGDTIVGDGMLLVGYIPQNDPTGTADGVDGNITIKAYLDKNKILISDTYDGTESDNMGTTNEWAEGKTVLTTSEWNAIKNTGVSFKVKVEANEGIWVNGSLEEIMRKNALLDDDNSKFVNNENPGIDFSEKSGDTNGKGIYMMTATENNPYPIMYYRGAVEDNNVIFANKCWKIIRTTDTGGTKLLYNGELGHVYIDDNYDLSAYDNVVRTGNQFEFDTNKNQWTVTLTIPSNGGNSGEANIKFTVAEAGNYTLKFNNPNSGPITATRGGTNLNPTSGVNEITLNNLTTSEEINIAYTHYNAPDSRVVMTVSLYKGQQIDLGVGCDNTGTASQITLNIGGNDTNTFKFNENGNSPAYIGYMYGDLYTANSGVVSGSYYDSTFVWDGTNYSLTNNATTQKSINAYYSCGEKTKTATCPSLRYYHGGGNYFILLTGGDGVEEALQKMQTNTTDSNAKEKIENWYEANMTSYTNRIEDTIYCNNRSVNNTNDFDFGNYSRLYNRTTATPILSCSNKNDSFTWKNSNGNMKLRYPVGMITADEIVLAGGKLGADNSFFYLKTGQNYWSMSPNSFGFYNASVFIDYYLGHLSADYVDISNGLRPMITIKPGQLITKGTGTVTDPYVIE